MKNVQTLLCALLICLTLSYFPAFGSGQVSSVEEDQQIWQYSERQSQHFYSEYTKVNKIVAAPAGWNVPLGRAFNTLMSNSDASSVNCSYVVVDNPSFNAMCLADGRILIHTGTLYIMDLYLEKIVGIKISQIQPYLLTEYRERLISPVFAHEISHRLNQHQFMEMKNFYALKKNNSKTVESQLIAYTREMEFDADKTAYILLKQAGYNPDLLIDCMELLNVINQNDNLVVASTESSTNVYLTDHPTPHARIAALKGSNLDFHGWALNMEMAFSDIQLGINLDKAVNTIDEALKQYPDNYFFLRQKAIALHKEWIATTSIDDLMLRGIIDAPQFRDRMIYSLSRGQRKPGDNMPIGDPIKFENAEKAYMKVIGKATDPLLRSNYSLLLAYSYSKKKRQLAVKEAKELIQYSDKNILNQYSEEIDSLLKLRIKNNSAVVFYVSGESDAKTAIKAFEKLSHEQLQIFKSAESNKKAAKSIGKEIQLAAAQRTYSPEYAMDRLTVLLNYYLCIYHTYGSNDLKEGAKNYFSYFGTLASSSWDEYLAKKSGIDLTSYNPRYYDVNGIKIDSSIDQIIKVLKKPEKIVTSSTGKEEWYYESKGITLLISSGLIEKILLLSPKSPQIEIKIGVGSTKNEIEKKLGKAVFINGNKYIYAGSQFVSVTYNANEAAAIELNR